MSSPNVLVVPLKITPPLDPEFQPIALADLLRPEAARVTSPIRLALALERNDALISVFRTALPEVGADGLPGQLREVERLVKFLLWQIGGWKLTVCGAPEIGAEIARIYSATGERAFDVRLMERVYNKTFTVEQCTYDETPQPHESSAPLGGHLDGCRVGFDLGASDYKLAAVKDGETLFTTEIPWDPKVEANPDAHYQTINAGLKLAASYLPRVDAIGGSSAGIYIDNEVMVASLFRAVPPEVFAAEVKPMFRTLQREWGVPLEVANDGDVTALAGAMTLGVKGGVLGIAMGSSLAAGYLDPQGCITGWLNELAFAPIDYQPGAPADEWSGDIGCGVQYFSQQAVVRLAKPAGIELPEVSIPEQLKLVQELHSQDDSRAESLFATIGVWFGYAVAQYAHMYEFNHILVLGRVTSGRGGEVIVAQARKVLELEFPVLAARIQLHLPDEQSKRHGQAVAAASLPRIG